MGEVVAFCCVSGRPRSCPSTGWYCTLSWKSFRRRSSFLSQIRFPRGVSSPKFESRLPSQLELWARPGEGRGEELLAGDLNSGGRSHSVSICFLCCCLFLRSVLPCPALKRHPPSPPASGPGLRRTACGSALSGSQSTPPPRPRGPRGLRATTCTGEWGLPAAFCRRHPYLTQRRSRPGVLELSVMFAYIRAVCCHSLKLSPKRLQKQTLFAYM